MAAEPTSQRAAWALVNILLLARMAGEQGDFVAAERWFHGDHTLPPLAAHVTEPGAALSALARVSYDDDLLELLPYVLEVHGPGTRLAAAVENYGLYAQCRERHGQLADKLR